MKKLSITTIGRDLLALIRTNPVEAIFGVLFFGLFVVSDLMDSSRYTHICFMFPVLFAVSYSFNHIFAHKNRFLYYLTSIAFLPVVIFAEHLEVFAWSFAYSLTLLLSLFLLFVYRKTSDNRSFAIHCVSSVVNILLSVFVGLLSFGAICAIYLSLTYIFDFNFHSDFISYCLASVFCLLAPLVFCRLQEWDEMQLERLPKIIRFIFDFILSPALVIYAIILYIYLFVIIFRWELPLGGVAYMVIAFVLVGLLGRLIQLIVDKCYYSRFYTHFGLIILAPLFLFWIGTLYRINTYGFTESRVYLLACGALMTFYAIMFCVKRGTNYRLMLLVSAIVIALLTYIPGISARSIGVASQAERMERMARELGLWDDSTGKLLSASDFVVKDSAQFYLAEQLESSHIYLTLAIGSKAMSDLYGEHEYNFYLVDTHQIKSYSLPLVNIPIDDRYRSFLPQCSMNSYSESGVMDVVDGDNRVILSVDVENHFAKYLDLIGSWDRGENCSAEPFCVSNDSCMVFISTILTTSDGRYVFDAHSDLTVFCK